jgi:uncharacterized Zn finger protein
MNIDIVKEEEIYILEAYVESEIDEGKYYKVKFGNEKWSCTCPAGKNRGKCKHIKAVMRHIKAVMRHIKAVEGERSFYATH